MNVDFENIDQLFEDSLEGMEITPSSGVKLAIQKKMFLHNTLKNVFVRISLVILLIASIGCSFVCFDSVNAPTIEEQFLLKENTVNSNYQSKSNRNSKIIIETKSNNSLNKQEQVVAEIHSQENKPNQVNKEPIKKERVSEETFQNSQSNKLKTKAILSNKESLTEINTREQVVNVSRIQTSFNTNNSELNRENNSTSDAQISNSHDLRLVTTNEVYVKEQRDDESLVSSETISNNELYVDKESNKETLATESSSSPNQNPESVQEESNITLLDLPVLDDTVGVNILGEAIVLSSDRWRIGAYIRPNYSLVSVKEEAAESNSVSDLNKQALSPIISYGFGVDISYQFKQLSVGMGLAYSRYQLDFTTKQKELQTTSTTYWDYLDVEHWNIDSVPYLNLDSLLQGDTVTTVIVDSVQYFTQDSTQNTRIDSNWIENSFNSRNVYSYFEIPLFMEYTFNRSEKWQPYVKLGLITGIHIRTSGYYASSEGKVYSLESLPFAKINFWSHTGLGLKYNLNKTLSVYSEANFRYNLNAIVKKEDYFNQHLHHFGVSFGIQYRF